MPSDLRQHHATRLTQPGIKSPSPTAARQLPDRDPDEDYPPATPGKVCQAVAEEIVVARGVPLLAHLIGPDRSRNPARASVAQRQATTADPRQQDAVAGNQMSRPKHPSPAH
jgi:hypothetical protein